MDGQLQLPQSYMGQVQPGTRPMANPAVEQEIAQIYAEKAAAARKQLEDLKYLLQERCKQGMDLVDEH